MSIPNIAFTVQNNLALVGQSTVGSELVVGTASQPPYDQMTIIGTPQQASGLWGSGPLVDAVAEVLDAASLSENVGGVVIGLNIFSGTINNAGVLTKTGTGTGTVTASGSPMGPYQFLITIKATGTLGTATFTYSLDNGHTTSPVMVIPASTGVFVIPQTGVTLTFAGGAGAFVATDTYAGGITQAAGTAGAVNSTLAQGTGVLGNAGSAPLDAYQVVVQIVAAGQVGTASFLYSVDGGLTFNANPITTVATYNVPGTGVVLTFTTAGSNVFDAGDIFSFSCTPPGYGLQDLINVFNLIMTTPLPPPFEVAWIVGKPGTGEQVDPGASGTAALAAVVSTMDTICQSMFAAKQFMFAIVESPTNTTQYPIDSALNTALASLTSDYVSVCSGDMNITSPVSGMELARTAAWAEGPRVAQVRPGHDLAEVDDGPCVNVVKLLRDENATAGLDNIRITSMRTLGSSQPGAYLTNGRILASPQSAFQLVQYRRVVNEVAFFAYPALLRYLNKFIRVDPATGFIDPVDANNVEQSVFTAVWPNVKKDISGLFVQIPLNVDILSTDILEVTLGIVPLAYAKQIAVTLSLINPFLALAAPA